MKKEIIILLVIVSIVSFWAGFGIGKFHEKETWQPEPNEIEKDLGELSHYLEMLSASSPEQVDSLFGSINEVGKDFLVMGTHFEVYRFPLLDEKETKLKDIKVNITEETEIFTLVPQWDEEKNRWVDDTKKYVTLEYIEVMMDYGFVSVKPKETIVKLGDLVLIESKGEIKKMEEITANQIEVRLPPN